MAIDMLSSIRSMSHRAATLAYGRFRLSSSPRCGNRILMYHAIGSPVADDIRGLYNMPFVQFETHMRFLAQYYGDKLISLKHSIVTTEPFTISLTFDDGFRDNLTHAAPFLVNMGIPFTVFICTGSVAKRDKNFLSPEDVRTLAGMPGASIGSHTINHPHLVMLDDRRIHNELAGSKAYLEDLVGTEVTLLSYPHGSVNRKVRDIAGQIGYQIGATSRFDINQQGRDPLLLCRTDIWAQDNLPVFEQKLRGDWDWNRWRTADPSQQ